MRFFDALGRFRDKDERRCQFCGCWTNAKLRFCCEAGYLDDGGRVPRRFFTKEKT